MATRSDEPWPHNLRGHITTTILRPPCRRSCVARIAVNRKRSASSRRITVSRPVSAILAVATRRVELRDWSGLARRNYMVPIPEAVSLDDLNEKILRQCVAYGDHKMAGRDRKVSELYEDEKAHLLSLPAEDIQQCAYVRRSRRQVRHSHRRQESIFRAQPLCGVQGEGAPPRGPGGDFHGISEAGHSREDVWQQQMASRSGSLPRTDSAAAHGFQQRQAHSAVAAELAAVPALFFLSVFAALKAKRKGSRTSSRFSCSTGIIRPARSKPRWSRLQRAT